MSAGNGKGISGKMAEIGGMLVKAADSAACQNSMVGRDCVKGAVGTTDHGAIAAIVFFQNINQSGVFQKLHVRKLLNFTKQGTGNFLSCYIFVENDPAGGMGTFFGVGKAAIFVSLEACAVGNKILYNFR